MKVIKRDLSEEQLCFDKILQRISKLAAMEDQNIKKLAGVDLDPLCIEIISNLYDGISTKEIDEISARICAGKIEHPDYNELAARIAVSNIQKNAPPTFSKAMEILYDNSDGMCLINDKVMKAVRKNKQKLNRAISHINDYLFDFFGIKTLEKSYLLKKIDPVTKKMNLIETPQFMLMRVALGLHNSSGSISVDEAIESYNIFKDLLFTHASPTLFNSGTRRQQNSSCFLMDIEDDLTGIMKTISDCAHISKFAGGIGINAGDIRAKGSVIKSTNGTTDGIVPLLQTINSITRYINQCFTPDTWVYSKEGPKQMGSITTDDYLVTIDGTFKKVNEVIKSEINKKILEITTTTSLDPVKVTNEHHIFVIKQHPENFRKTLLKVKQGVLKPEFCEAKDIKQGDLVGFPIPNYIKDNCINDLNYYRIYGTNQGNSCQELLDEYLHLPKDKICEILEGLITSNSSHPTEPIFTNSSKKLVLQVKYLLLRLGVLTTTVNFSETSFSLVISGNTSEYFEHDGLLWCQVKTINKIQYTGEVIDFNMEDNHNYLTDLGLVHNSGKRKGSAAIYLPTFHADIQEFLELRKNTGDENMRARDLFYALWVSDYFMDCVEKDLDWHLLSPDECPGLTSTYGEEHTNLHKKYIEDGKTREIVKARDIWAKIIVAQIETGMPYILFADSVNKKNNQENLGTIKNSNLCVAPETKILTSDGYLEIQSLEDKTVSVWNGEEFSKVIVRKTASNQPLMKVNFSNGSDLYCTDYHTFYDYLGNKVQTKDLTLNTKLLSCGFPVIVGNSEDLKNNGIVPICSVLPKKLEWVQNFLDRESLQDYFGCYYIENPCREYLVEVMYLFNTLGCGAKVESIRNSYKITLSRSSAIKLKFMGVKLKWDTPHNTEEQFDNLVVTNVTKTNRVSDTYCFTEPKRGMGVFNGVLTGNCAEVLLHSDSSEVAVCNIATVSFPKFVETSPETGEKFINYEKLGKVVEAAVVNLNKVIDINFYPIKETETSNKNHRPIIVGGQGLQNLFFELRLPFDSEEAKQINSKLYETIQYHSLKKSCELAKIHGPYSSFEGSPASKGIFQHNMWGISNESLKNYDWEALKEQVMEFGLRNSMLTATPPTASTSQVLGNLESMEPITNNFMTRNTLSGDFPIINKYLVNDLIKLNLWDTKMKDRILHSQGSIQDIPEIPDDLKKLYKTVWEIPQRVLIDMSRDRGIFTDHTQSLNLYVTAPSIAKISSMHFYSWKQGLKTGCYYLRTRSITSAIQFTVSKENIVKKDTQKEMSDLYCSIDNKDACVSCSG